MARVFISSTYQDLIDERDAVADAVQRLGHQPIGMEHFGADTRPVVQKCCDDVRSCEAMVLVLGHRYGWVPPGYGGRSITQIEYETAVEAKLRQILCYHTESPARALLGIFGRENARRANEFRAMVQSAHMSKPIRSAAHVREEIAFDLNAGLGKDDPIPPAVPFLCDRSVQRDQLYDTLSVPDLDVSRPHVWLVHGRFEQAHEQFVERVRDEFIPDLTDPSGRSGVRHVTLEWPREKEPDAAWDRFRQRLEVALGGRSRGERVVDTLAAQPGTVLVTVEVPFCRWEPTWSPDVVHRIVDELDRWPAARREAPVVFALWVRYDTGADALEQDVRTTWSRVAEAHAGSGRVSVLAELDDADFADVTAWAGLPSVLDVLHGRRLTAVELKAAVPAPRMPMSPLAMALTQLLRSVRTRS